MPYRTVAEQDGPPGVLAIHLLSSFRVFVNNEPVNGRLAGKARGLLKVLASHYDANMSRDALIEMLWAHSDPSIGAVSLKVAAHNLRRALEPEKKSGHPGNWIVAQNGSYRLNPDADIWIDVQALRHHFERGLAYAAAENGEHARVEFHCVEKLYVGDLLEDDMYEDWTILRREEMRDIFLDAVSRLADLAWKERSYSDVIRLCHRIVNVDPCREDAYRMLMRSHAALNQFARAGAWYAVCRQTLKREMDAMVSRETSDLFERLFEGDAEGEGAARMRPVRVNPREPGSLVR